MDIITLGARLLLAAVFAVAGVAKLADREGSRKALRDFGVPDLLAEPGAVALPAAELAVAVALIPDITAWWGALGAALLLSAFIGGIVRSMARGEAPDCHCFGQVYSEPAGWRTLIRNVVLLAVAGLIVAQGRSTDGISALRRIGHLTDGEWITVVTGLVLLAVLVVMGWLVWRLAGMVGRLIDKVQEMEERIAEVPWHTAVTEESPEASRPTVVRAPSFVLSTLERQRVRLDDLLAPGKPLLMLFASATCGPCTTALTHAGRWQAQPGSQLRIVPVIDGGEEAARAKASELNLINVMLQDGAIAAAYGAHTMPSAVVVNPDGTIGSEVAVGPDAIVALFDNTVQALAAAVSTEEAGSEPAHTSDQPVIPDAVRVSAATAVTEVTGNGNGHSALGPSPEQPPSRESAGLDGNLEQGPRDAVQAGASEPSANADGTVPPASDGMGLSDGSSKPADGSGEGVSPVVPMSAIGAEEEPAPMVAPAFALANLAGETVTLEELRAAGNPILLLFASAGCGPCTVALTEAGRWQAAHGTAISIVPLILGGADAAQAKATALGLSNVLIQDAEVAPAYGATMPSAVRVKPDGTIGSEVARGPDEIRALFEEMAGIAALPEASSAETASPEPAEAELLSALRQSVEHHAVRPRMADPDPVDSWQEDGLHFFVFRLSRAPGTEESDSPTAVFVMRVDEDEPVSAVVVTPDGNGDPDVIDLRQPNRLDAATV